VRLLGDQALVRVQNPVQLGDLSEPEPDLAVVTFDRNDYSTRHPNATDILLLIEVADSTLRFDRTQKRRLYATHAIPEYWIVNLIDHCLEVYRQPQDGDYLDHAVLSQTDSLCLQALPAVQIAVSAIL
jgi:Uma2 family endonuclease